MYGFGKIDPKVWAPSLKNGAVVRSLWRRWNKNGPGVLLGSQAFQRGFIRRNPPRDDEARLKSLLPRRWWSPKGETFVLTTIYFVVLNIVLSKSTWKVWKRRLESLWADLVSLRAESIAVCMQRSSFRRRSQSWETSFDCSEMKIRALPGVEVRTQQWGLGLDFKSSEHNRIFHDFSCGPYRQLRIAL